MQLTSFLKKKKKACSKYEASKKNPFFQTNLFLLNMSVNKFPIYTLLFLLHHSYLTLHHYLYLIIFLLNHITKVFLQKEHPSFKVQTIIVSLTLIYIDMPVIFIRQYTCMNVYSKFMLAIFQYLINNFYSLFTYTNKYTLL